MSEVLDAGTPPEFDGWIVEAIRRPDGGTSWKLQRIDPGGGDGAPEYWHLSTP